MGGFLHKKPGGEEVSSRFDEIKDKISRDWGYLVSGLLANAPILAIWAIVVPVLSLNYYLRIEGVPLSVFSSGALSALPAVLALMVWVVVLFVSCFSIPAVCVFLLPGDVLGVMRGGGIGGVSGWFSSCYWRYGVVWVVVVVGCFAIAPKVAVLKIDDWRFWGFLLSFLASFVALVRRVNVLASMWGGKGRTCHTCPGVGDLLSFAFSMIFFHVVLAVGGYTLWYSLGFFDNLLLFLTVYLLVQSFSVFMMFFLWSVKKKVLTLCVSLMCLVMLCAVSPWSSVFVVSDLFSRAEMGGRECIVFRFVENKGVDPDLISSARSTDESVPLRVVFASSSTIYARPRINGKQGGQKAGSRDIYQFPRSAISKASDCSGEQKTEGQGARKE